MDVSRRDLLAAASAFAAGILVPFDVKGAAPSPGPEELHAQAVALTRRISLSEPSIDSPASVLETAHRQFHIVKSAIGRTGRAHQRPALHRAASMTARVCALASRWSGIAGQQWVTIAEAEAKAAGDGPLLAHAWLERSSVEGTFELFAERPYPARLTLVSAALDRAGIADDQANLRAFTRQERAWELAMAGNRRGALVELDAAMAEAEKAGWRNAAVHEMVGVGLRTVGRAAEAERSLCRALDQPPVRRVWDLCELAQTRLALGDADAAARHLGEAFLLTRAHSVTGRLPRILAVRALLPLGRAARELDEVMHSV